MVFWVLWGKLMQSNIENLRLLFPAEVTGAYFAIVALLTQSGFKGTEHMQLMLSVAVALATCNTLIYLKVHRIKSIWTHVFVTLGFFIWVANIDTSRFVDLLFVGEYIEISAPIGLVFFTLASAFFEIRNSNLDGPVVAEILEENENNA